MKTKKWTPEDLEKEAQEWNSWQPGSGRKGWSPFDKPIPPVRMGTIPLKDGKIDMKRWEEELNGKKL